MVTATTDLFYSASAILSSSNDLSRRVNIQNTKKSQRTTIPRNQVFTDSIVDSFLVSSTLSLPRQDVTKLPPPSNKRYVSSFKTLVHSTNLKQTQRLNYVNDSVMILKLSKDNVNDSNTSTNSNFSSKYSTLSVTTSSNGTFAKTSQQGARASPTLKIEGQKHRIVNHESSLIVPTPIDLTLPVQSMAASTTTQALLQAPSSTTNSTLFTYRSAAAGGNPVRQRVIAESTANSLLISAEKFKANVSSTSNLRQARQSVTNPTSLPSTLIPSTQRNVKSRIQQEKIANTKEVYSYSDPFTNCPQEILNKLSQLTKLQLETIDWEKKKRFTKKKPLTNTLTQGKDSP